jgi:hypothetical protein
MNKKTKMIALASAALAASSSMLLVTEAEAGRRGGFHFHHRVWTPSFSSSSYEEKPTVVYRRVIERRVIEKKAAPVVAKYADGKGREFDLASKVWFDGKGKCFSGKDTFSFKNGVWFYGGARWYEAKGEWKTNASEQPMPIDCEASPKFAGLVKPADDRKPAGGESAKVEKATAEKTPAITPSGSSAAVKTAEQKAADKPVEAPKANECKKYFPSVGEVLTVACE